MSWLERVVLSTPMLAGILRGIGKCSKEALWIILVGGFCLRSSEEVATSRVSRGALTCQLSEGEPSRSRSRSRSHRIPNIPTQQTIR